MRSTTRGRCDRSASPASCSVRYRATHRCTVDRCTPTRAATSITVAPCQHRPNRVQPLLDHRQDNQCQSRPPRVPTPRGDVGPRVAETRPLSQITWRTTCRTSPDGGQPADAHVVRTFCTGSRRPASRAAAPPNQGRADGPPLAPRPAATARSVIAPPAARHTKKPRAAMVDGSSGASMLRREKGVPPAGSSGTPGWLAPSRQPPSGQSRAVGPARSRSFSRAGCSTLTGQAPPTPQGADEGRQDG